MSRRTSRLLVQAVIFIGMASIAYVSEEFYLALVTAVALISLPFVWTAAGLLLWASRRGPEIESLADAADNLMTVAINTTVAVVVAIVVVARLMGLIPTVGLVALVGLGYIIVTNILPATRALATFRDVWLPRIRS